ncbi:MAG: cation diffusion facilitator family transporter [Clostridia bacterium]|nr:cation diffusion facilitator family transporter [Clostridia bacterium]
MSEKLTLDEKQKIKMEDSTGDGKVSYNRIIKVVITSVVGIVVNLILGGIKVFVGLASNSIAIISDAVNNFTDSVSSLVTIITMVIVGRGATRKHPFGFGRVEYFTSMIIAALVLFAGGEFLISSVKKIISPEPTSYTWVSIVLLVVAILAKIALGFYTKSRGKKLNSPNLEASGADALSDAIITSVTLIGALISIFTDIVIDGFIGAIVSTFVLKAGFEIMLGVVGELLGKRPYEELAEEIMEEIRHYDGIVGAYDLILHNYGPNVYIGNVNVELDESISIRDAYEIIHPLNVELFNKYGVFFYFGFYSINVSDEDVKTMRETVTKVLMEDPDILQIHAFYVDTTKKNMSFDAVMDFSVKTTLEKSQKLKKKLLEIYPDYDITVVADRDFTLKRQVEE